MLLNYFLLSLSIYVLSFVFVHQTIQFPVQLKHHAQAVNVFHISTSNYIITPSYKNFNYFISLTFRLSNYLSHFRNHDKHFLLSFSLLKCNCRSEIWESNNISLKTQWMTTQMELSGKKLCANGRKYETIINYYWIN